MKFLLLSALLLPVVPAQDSGAPEVAASSPRTGDSEHDSYEQEIAGTAIRFKMIALAGGTFLMGSPEGEDDRKGDEGPQHKVQVAPFWIEEHEVTWNEYFLYNQRPAQEEAKTPPGVDSFSRPTPPYVPMDFGMGTDQFPAVCMTQFAAKQYTRWLSESTGVFYRLPTEAEWEYACRAGTTTAYSWGDDPDQAEDYAWSFDNADDGYRTVMSKKPNPFGLYDMHGNVSEWVMDFYVKAGYGTDMPALTTDPLIWPTDLYPRVVRGGSWDDDVDRLRSASRRASTKSWKIQDPQLPKSIWYHTDAQFVGFRVVRPLHEPTEEQKRRYWDADLDSLRRTLKRQSRGER